jgi:hypothetical protein
MLKFKQKADRAAHGARFLPALKDRAYRAILVIIIAVDWQGD